jgi:uncharacterized protein (UPF0548 family)
MFLIQRPDERVISRFLDSQRGLPFTYPDVGASRGTAAAGYNVDHNRVRLGHGPETFSKAVDAVRRWKMFEMSWIKVGPHDAPIAEGSCVAIVVQHFGFWSLNASRIVYVVDESSKRFGFAYGTLPGHVEQGEERFTVEYHPEDESVWYDLFAFSRPRHILSRAGYPISRRLQARFAQGSLRAMEEAVRK